MIKFDKIFFIVFNFIMDKLGDRMKNYEDRFRTYLPKRSYTLIRLDGKAFHTYTRGFDKPFDVDLINAMDNTAKVLCEKIQGAKIAYVQSDEITLLLEDFATIKTESYFDGNIQKITSITASIATAYFNDFMKKNSPTKSENLAYFDSRCWSLSDPYEVENTFIWRQKDAVRNSIQLVAQSLFSSKQTFKKSQISLLNMIIEKGTDWNKFPNGLKQGRIVIKNVYPITVEDNNETKFIQRSRWDILEAPLFTVDRDFLRQKISLIPNWKME